MVRARLTVLTDGAFARANDVILGSAGAGTLSGDGGDDVILASDGADSASGGPGGDVLDGGAGLDIRDGGGDAGDVLLNGEIVTGAMPDDPPVA